MKKKNRYELDIQNNIEKKQNIKSIAFDPSQLFGP